MESSEIMKAALRGEPVYCPTCGAELLNALSDESATRLGVHPGLHCPADGRHFAYLVELESRHRQFWELFEQKQAERKRRDAAAEGRTRRSRRAPAARRQVRVRATSRLIPRGAPQ